jgi:hypothetical protein
LGWVCPKQPSRTTVVKALVGSLSNPILYFDLENLNDYAVLENDPYWFLEQYLDKIVAINEV